MRTRLSLLAVLIALACGPDAAATTGNGPDRFTPVKLRGYGTLSGARLETGPQSAILRVTAESVPKAEVVLAKYLSDLEELPGVTRQPMSTARGGLVVRLIDGQGAAAAVRSGVNVYIFTAEDAKSLQVLFEAHVPAKLKIDARDAEVPVPMYLDRWDRGGFRFYYKPFAKPPGASDYDPAQDFQFAQDSQHSGLVVGDSPSRLPLADGVLDFNSCEWVYRAGRERALPMGVNPGFGDALGFLRMRAPQDLAPNGAPYVGGRYGAMNFGSGPTIAWSAGATQDEMLGELKPLVQRLKPENSVVNWVEPHEEMGHGATDLLDDHGPTARDSFQHFLEQKYQTPEAVAARWRQPGAFRTWAAVPFPEVATFCGWDKEAIDLQGPWQISRAAPYGAASAKPDLDDSSWATLEAPGDAIALALPRQPAVFRRHFQVDPAWRKAHPKAWLWCFDLNDTRKASPSSGVRVFVNGRAVPEAHPRKMESHWAALDVGSALVDGPNVVTICVPQGLLDYRVYITGVAPAVYPALGERLDAMWADFSDWTAWSRGQAVRRGMQMIRQVDPDRPITLLAPEAYLGPIEEDAEDYGGILHDTGGTAGAWRDVLPVLQAGRGLPTEDEPRPGATDLDDFKRFLGRWITEGTNGVDYFPHIGDIEWKPEIRDYFTKTQNLWHLLGKYHAPPPELAILASDRNERLTGFPWDSAEVAPDLVQRNRFSPLISGMVEDYPRGGVLEQDFARGIADKFRVILDGNTTIMDPETVDAIAAWVKRGGVFITYQQTGRHTSAVQDSWPITKLTGYAVTSLDRLKPNGDGVETRTLEVVPGQQVFDPGAPGWKFAQNGAGLSLKKIDPACVDLLQWDDGSIAAGWRPLGKGMVIDLGANSDELPPQVLKWLRLPRMLIHPSNPKILARHFVSNNGLYDVWAAWNTTGGPVTTAFTFREGVRPAGFRDVNTGAVVPGDSDANGVRLSNIAFGPWETHVYLSPRRQLDLAAADWFTLQRGWWSGAADPGKPVPEYHSKLCVDLTDDWACKLVPGPIHGAPPEDASMADPTLDDSGWPHVRAGIFNLPDNTDCRHAFFRRTFIVPPDWTHGLVRLFARVEGQGSFREYLDGKPYQPAAPDDEAGGAFKPGSRHCLVVEAWGDAPPTGPTTPFFLSYRPDPVATQDLGSWAFAADCLKFDAPAALPRAIPSGGAVRTVVTIDPRYAGRSVFVHVGAGCDLVIVNGHATPGYPNSYKYADVNATPWVNFGAENTIVAVFRGPQELSDARLEFYDKSQYP